MREDLLAFTQRAASVFAILLTNACHIHAQPAWPITFSAYMVTEGVIYGCDVMPPSNKSMEGIVALDASKLMTRDFETMPDGRSLGMVQQMKENIKLELQPFFNDVVCYRMPDSIGNASGAFQEAVDGYFAVPREVYMRSRLEGSSLVDGQACDVYAANQSYAAFNLTVLWNFCVKRDGSLLRYNGTGTLHKHNQSLLYSKYSGVFHNHTTRPDPSLFQPTPDCVDLVPTATMRVNTSTPVNDHQRIRDINAAAQGHWTAAPTASFGLKATLGDAAIRLGTKLRALRLSTAPEPLLSDEPLPKAFDARTRWPACRSIATIRNQGSCGSCWAFSAVEVLADRTCVAALNMAGNLTLSPEYLLDCDQSDNGCAGGFLDDAWKFLQTRGAPAERCVPYQHCPHPETPDCKLPPASVNAPESPPAGCPSACTDGSQMSVHRAGAVYAVARPADAPSMQREIMSHGPIQVAFYVWSDFMNYKNGTYMHTKTDESPLGAHAVRILGWGVDDQGVDYWLAANSWSPGWGMDGYFRIRRGCNECGIETTPAAGMPPPTWN